MNSLPPPPLRRELGKSGILISPLGWGTWRLPRDGRTREDARRLLHAVVEAGINFVDTADIYGFDGRQGFGGAECYLGEALRTEPDLRTQLVIATKGGIRPPLPYDQSPQYLREAIDNSLQRLRVETLDLYQIHRPDILTHPQEVARVLDDAVAAGKVRALGVSNFTLQQTEALAGFLGNRLVTTQPEISPLRIECFENGELDQAMRLGMTPLAWSPLAGGELLMPSDSRSVDVSRILDAFADRHGASRSDAAYSWLMAHPAGIVPIVGSQSAKRIREAMKALALRWSRQDWYAVLTTARGQRLP